MWQFFSEKASTYAQNCVNFCGYQNFEFLEFFGDSKKSARENRKPTRENSWNFGRETIFLTREKNRKSGRENTKMAVKKPKKVGVKNDFCPWKKLEIGPKMAFTPTFEFHAQKKNTAKYW